MEMLQVFAATVVLCLTAWIVALLWAGHQLDRRSAAMLEEQQAIFHAVLPQATRTSTQVVRRLESELKRLTDGGRAGAIADSVPTYAMSAFSLLYEVFKGLPDASPDGGASYRLMRLDVTDQTFRLDAIADTHDDAGRIAQHLADRAGVHVNPPRTDDAQDMGVRFTITGTRRSVPKGSLHLSKAIEP
jgi:plasmid stabilization system protein ParE